MSAVVPENKRQPLAVVQKDAVVQRDGKSTVFVIRDGIARAINVTTGQAINDDIELQGVSATVESVKGEAKPDVLKVGDRIVLKPPAELKDGNRVSLIQK